MVASQTCPICNRPLIRDNAAAKVFPFCSDRCRKVDLFRWCDGRYAIVEPLDPEAIDPETLAEADESAPDF